VLRLGWLLFDGDVCAVAGTAEVPNQLLNSWKLKKQQIFTGETLCMLVVPLLHGGLLQVDVHLIALAAASLRTPRAFRPRAGQL